MCGGCLLDVYWGRLLDVYWGRLLDVYWDVYWTCIGPGDQTGRPYIVSNI